MSTAKQVKVLKNCKLLGKERRSGEFIPPADFFSLGANIQSALIGSHTVEVIGSDSSPDQLFEVIQRLQASVDRLVDRVEALENGKKPPATVKEGSKEEPESYTPKKGDFVSFMAEDESGTEYTETGKVTSIVKTKGFARVISDDGYKYEVNFCDLTKIDS